MKIFAIHDPPIHDHPNPTHDHLVHDHPLYDHPNPIHDHLVHDPPIHDHPNPLHDHLGHLAQVEVDSDGTVSLSSIATQFTGKTYNLQLW